MNKTLALDHYRLLGRSGLRVSPLGLGTMTFGVDWKCGADLEESRRIFDAYAESGGNFIDTANCYTDGSSEEFVGRFTTGRRDQFIVATKYTMPARMADPNSGGNHRKSMVRSVEGSLRRLDTDYVDLLYLHGWDSTTPVEEILRAMDDLVQSGKVLYLGISNTPAWQVARMQAIADLRGWSRLISLQIPYSLVERTVERDLIPMAREMGLGVVPWSPLGGGILTGKYTSADLESNGTSTSFDGSRRPFVLESGNLSKRNLEIASAVKRLAQDIGKSPAQVSLAWTLQHVDVTSPIIGARTLTQFKDNIDALDLALTENQCQQLDDASAIEMGFPHDFLVEMAPRFYVPLAIEGFPRHASERTRSSR